MGKELEDLAGNSMHHRCIAATILCGLSVCDAGKLARNIARVVAADLSGTGLFRELTSDAYISKVTSFDAPVAYNDWQAINTEALITGAVSVNGDKVVVKFRLYDIVSGQAMGDGLQFVGSAKSWRRMAHKVADAVYSRITGEGGYFDSRVVFVSESVAGTDMLHPEQLDTVKALNVGLSDDPMF
jgi:Tol biopolymer transport system component